MNITLENKGLVIEATTVAECREVINHFKLDPFEYMTSMATQYVRHEVRPSKRDNEEYFEVEYTVPMEFVKPYFDKLSRITGFAEDIPTIDPAARYSQPYNINLQYTHIVTEARISSEGYYFKGFQRGSTWNNQVPIDYAHRLFREYVTAELGHTKHEREFVEMSNGLFKHNPNYLKRHAPTPQAEGKAFWICIWNWWVANRASDAQKEVLIAAEKCHRSICKEGMAEYLHRAYDGHFRLDWGKNIVSYTEFQGMK